MCRICGRMVKCIFESMPSRTVSQSSLQASRHINRAGNKRSYHSHVSSRTFLRAAFNIHKPNAPTSPPTFLLPFRSKLSTATATRAEVLDDPPPPQQHNPELPPDMLQTTFNPFANASTSFSPSLAKPLVLSRSLQDLLPHLTTQRPHYITAHIHRFPYLLTTGDTLRLPFHMHGVQPGDILRLNRASLLGSRDYTLKAGTNTTETYDSKRTGEPNYLDERLFECRARVMSLESTPMAVLEKTKRRNRRVKTVKSKHRYTVIRVMEVKVKGLEELKMEEGTLLLEN